MKFRDIPQITQARYSVDVSWDYLKDDLERYDKNFGLILDPTYQRGYIWTEAQKVAYVEYKLRGGTSGGDIYWNCPGWMGKEMRNHPIEIVDGKQRLSAVVDFLDNKIPAFGLYRKDYEDKLHGLRPSFKYHVLDLKDRKELLKWYIAMNTGGSAHTMVDLQPAFDELNKLERETNG